MPNYPEKFIKGISNSNYIKNDGVPNQDLFIFYDRDAREDGWIEQSINWHDDNKAISFSMNQVKADGEIHFKGGVAVVLTEDVERLRRRQIYAGMISYERDKKPDNPYHGNLLLIKNILKQTKKAIEAHLTILSEIIPRT